MAATKKTTIRTRTAKKATASRTAKRPANADLDNSLFLPRLDLLELTESQQEGSGPDYGEILESICGVVDDSQAVEQYDGTLGVTAGFVDAHQLPVAQVQWNANLGAVFTNPGNVNGVRWGSGTMIGPNLFLTCGHLFDPDPNGWTIPRANGTSNAITPQQAATNMHLNFEFQVDENGVMRVEQSFPITQLIEYRLGNLDMALCRVGGNPGTIYGWSEFGLANAPLGDMLAIIGHPAGQPKRIEAGPLTAVNGSVVRYNDIDTLGGNSGSGILHGPTGRVVGVHTNGGCNSQGTGSNSGVAIAAIVAASPTLQATTPSSQTRQGSDLIATRLALDVGPTIRASDNIFTRLADDNVATRLAADVLGTGFGADTGTLRDQLGTTLAGDVGTFLAGDVGTFGGGDDPDLTRVEGVVDPGSILVDPVVNPGLTASVRRARPFVQAGASLQSEGGDAGSTVADALLAEVEQLIVANAAVAESLQALHAVLSQTIEAPGTQQ